jgi:hypothetical protein
MSSILISRMSFLWESINLNLHLDLQTAELFLLSTSMLRAEPYAATDGQPASLSWNKAPIWGFGPYIYYLCDSYGFVLVGRPLWRKDGSVFYICCWPLPAQSLFGPSPLGLTTMFYSLRFETSFFVASYDSQGHGGSIQSRLHTGIPLSVFHSYF